AQIVSAAALPQRPDPSAENGRFRVGPQADSVLRPYFPFARSPPEVPKAAFPAVCPALIRSSSWPTAERVDLTFCRADVLSRTRKLWQCREKPREDNRCGSPQAFRRFVFAFSSSPSCLLSRSTRRRRPKP